jgi:FkbM family methyltransferase
MSLFRNVAKNVLASVGLLAPILERRRRQREAHDRRRTTRLYRDFIAPGDLCFDIGAHRGDVSASMLSLGARVVAIEPQSESVELLQSRFSADPNFVLVPKAVAAEVGWADLMICDSSDCSSMSSEFISAVRSSGRLNLDICKWNEVRSVPTTTLNELIREYGMPDFTKIDVEGCEDEVLQGCSSKLKALSFEFTPERLQPALRCIDLLERLGMVEFNYTIDQRGDMQLSQWVRGDELAHILQTVEFRIVRQPPGDVYARFT